MKKFISLVSGLLLLSSAFAESGQGGAAMAGANRNVIDECRRHDPPGIALEYSERVNNIDCKYEACAYDGVTSDNIVIRGDNERWTNGCDANYLRNKAKQRKLDELQAERARLDRESARVGEVGTRTNGAGGAGGAQGGPGGAGGAQGGPAGAGGAQGGPGGAGGPPSPGTSGATISSGGTTGTGQPGGASSDREVVLRDGEFFCVTIDGDVAIGRNHACYKDCNPKTGFLGLGGRKYKPDSRKCMECMMNLGYDFDAEAKRRAGIATMRVRMKECRDANGNVVQVPYHRTCDLPGMSNGSSGGGVIVRGSSNGAGSGNGGGVIVRGGGSGGSGDADLPTYCQRGHRDFSQSRCDSYWRSQRRTDCSAGSRDCPVDQSRIYVSRTGGEDCVNCRSRRSGSGVGDILGGIAAIVGAGAPIAVSAINGGTARSVARIGADAYKYGVDACQTGAQNYLAFTQANELVAPSSSEYASMTSGCNGSSYGAYAGLGGYGIGGLLGAGYSPGYIGGMMGPYGMYNPYGTGGGIIGGVSGGGLISGLLGGGSIGGLSLINGGIGGGIGTIGGTVGYIGGYPSTIGGIGYVNGGIGGGIGYIGGGIGTIGGTIGTIGGVGYINGGIGGGIGYIGGGIGYIGGGIGTIGGGIGYIGGGIGTIGGTVGYIGGTTGYIGGGIGSIGGIGGTIGGYNTAAYSQMAMNRDAMLQQQGAAYQMSAMSGSAAYNPYQVGIMGTAGLTGFGF